MWCTGCTRSKTGASNVPSISSQATKCTNPQTHMHTTNHAQILRCTARTSAMLPRFSLGSMRWACAAATSSLAAPSADLMAAASSDVGTWNAWLAALGDEVQGQGWVRRPRVARACPSCTVCCKVCSQHKKKGITWVHERTT